MRSRSWIYVILITVTIIGMNLLLSQVPAKAGAVKCSNVSATSTTDTDGDGFTNYQECNGITFASGTTFTGYSNKGSLPRSGYLDPNSKDIFVILVRSDDPGGLGGGPTKITRQLVNGQYSNAADVAYWFQYFSNPVGQNADQYGLGLAVHLITAAQATTDRTVCPNCPLPTGQTVPQKAIRVTESLDQTADNVLGYTSLCGTPNGTDLTTVYTQKIYNLIKSILGSVSQEILDLYIRHTIAHEMGHTSGPLAPVNYPQYGQYHYQSIDNGLIMDQSVYHLYIGTQYTSGDQGGVHLK